MAAKEGDIPTVEHLIIEFKINPGIVNEEGEKLISHASHHGHLARSDEVFGRGAKMQC